MIHHVVGVDPGLVHTGCVRLVFDPAEKIISESHVAIDKDHAAKTRVWVVDHRIDKNWPHVFIEKYQPRSHLGTDARMATLQGELRAMMPSATVLLNTGVKKVVRKPLMELIEVWSFPTTTHHQDLRSAARIALYGMLKDPVLNEVLADVVRDYLNRRPWHVAHD